MIKKTIIDGLNFVKTHELVSEDGKYRFASLVSKDKLKSQGFTSESCVYLWARELSQEELDIIYVGKAGSGVMVRLGQHEGGFRNSGTGKKNLEALKELIDKGDKIHVFARVAEKITLFDTEVSLYSTEEEALLSHLSPWLNRAGIANSKSPFSNRHSELSCDNEIITGIDDLPLAEEIHAFLDSLSARDISSFTKLFSWSLKLTETQGLEQKLSKGYTNQPSGFNMIPMLVYTKVGRAGKALPLTWRVRLSLDKVGIVLPLHFIKDSIDQSKVSVDESGKAFAPKCIEDFLNEPSSYTTMS